MTEHDQQPLSEAAIAGLIATEDRFVPPTLDEIARIRFAAAIDEASGEVIDLTAVPIEVDDVGRSGRYGWVAVAAAIVVVISFAVFGGSESGTIEAADRTEGAVALHGCPSAVEDLGLAIESWNGIGNWASAATNVRYWQQETPVDPDLIELSLVALASLDDGDAEDVLAAKDAVSSLPLLEEIPPASEFAQPLRDAVAVIDLRTAGPSCHLGSLFDG